VVVIKPLSLAIGELACKYCYSPNDLDVMTMGPDSPMIKYILTLLSNTVPSSAEKCIIIYTTYVGEIVDIPKVGTAMTLGRILRPHQHPPLHMAISWARPVTSTWTMSLNTYLESNHVFVFAYLDVRHHGTDTLIVNGGTNVKAFIRHLVRGGEPSHAQRKSRNVALMIRCLLKHKDWSFCTSKLSAPTRSTAAETKE
jgi:hypothetical protein